MSDKDSVDVESASWSCSSNIKSLDSTFELTLLEALDSSLTHKDKPRIPVNNKTNTIPRKSPLELLLIWESPSLVAEIFMIISNASQFIKLS